MPPRYGRLTGFDAKKLVAATGFPANDPWRRREEWRIKGPFTRWNRWKGSLPGLGTATVAFTVYCVYEYFFMHDKSHGAGSHHEIQL